MDRNVLDTHADDDGHKYIEIVNPSPLNGTLYNYFHFLYGLLFPLLLFDAKITREFRVTYIFDFNLASMDRIIHSIPLDIKLKQYIANYKALKVYKCTLKAMDIGEQPKYKKDLKAIKKNKAQYMTYEMKKIINRWFDSRISNHNAFTYVKKYPIIFITRENDRSYESLSFKDKRYAKRVKTHGANRRNILNNDELIRAVKDLYTHEDVLTVSFEFVPILHQYILLNNCKLLICQHGAVLGNMAFMKKNSYVIEIVQRNYIDNGENWFKYFGEEFKLTHKQLIVESKTNHFFVNPSIFIDFIKKNIHIELDEN